MADTKPPAPSRGKGPGKGAPAPKGLGAKLNKEVHIGPLHIPYWGIGAIALGAWWLWFHVIQPYNAQNATDTGYGGANLGSGSGGGGGGGQTGAANPPHRHGRNRPHRHRGGHNRHNHQPTPRPHVRPRPGNSFQPSTFNPSHSGAGVGRQGHRKGNR